MFPQRICGSGAARQLPESVQCDWVMWQRPTDVHTMSEETTHMPWPWLHYDRVVSGGWWWCRFVLYLLHPLSQSLDLLFVGLLTLVGLYFGSGQCPNCVNIIIFMNQLLPPPRHFAQLSRSCPITINSSLQLITLTLIASLQFESWRDPWGEQVSPARSVVFFTRGASNEWMSTFRLRPPGNYNQLMDRDNKLP